MGWGHYSTAGHLQRRLHACRKARNKLAQRPWRVDDLDAFSDRWFTMADGDASMLLPSVCVWKCMCVSQHTHYFVQLAQHAALLFALLVCVHMSSTPGMLSHPTSAWHDYSFGFLGQEVCFQAVMCCEINCLFLCMASLGVHNHSQLSAGRSAQRQTAVAACKGCACCAGEPRKPYKRVIMFVDNAGADILLGMLPLARCFTCHSYCTST